MVEARDDKRLHAAEAVLALVPLRRITLEPLTRLVVPMRQVVPLREVKRAARLDDAYHRRLAAALGRRPPLDLARASGARSERVRAYSQAGYRVHETDAAHRAVEIEKDVARHRRTHCHLTERRAVQPQPRLGGHRPPAAARRAADVDEHIDRQLAAGRNARFHGVKLRRECDAQRRRRRVAGGVGEDIGGGRLAVCFERVQLPYDTLGVVGAKVAQCQTMLPCELARCVQQLVGAARRADRQTANAIWRLHVDGAVVVLRSCSELG